MSKKPFNVVVAEDYELNGETRTNFTRVGKAWPRKNGEPGMSVQLARGISISGDFVILPPKD